MTRVTERFQTSDVGSLADRVSKSTPDTIDEEQEKFVQERDMFFSATADGDGRPQCSYKGGEPGCVRGGG